MLHLRELLQTQYGNVNNNPSKALAKNERIEGFMEAGLISGMVTRNELKQVINDAHKAVYGVTFDERSQPHSSAEGLMDIPTWIRKGVSLGKGLKSQQYLPKNSIDELYDASLNAEDFAKELFHSENKGVTYTRLGNFCHKMNDTLEHLVRFDAEANRRDIDDALANAGFLSRDEIQR